jgi:hypothetical protein
MRVFKVRRKCRRGDVRRCRSGETMHVARLPFEIRFERAILDVSRCARFARARANERARRHARRAFVSQAIACIVHTGCVICKEREGERERGRVGEREREYVYVYVLYNIYIE